MKTGPDEAESSAGFGTQNGDIHALARAIEGIFGIRLENREALYQGGEYYLGPLSSGRRLGIFRNYVEHDERYREPHAEKYELIVYLLGERPGDSPEFKRLAAEVEGLVPLKAPPAVERRVNVIDVEATCWDGPPPEGQESEIIEIGITVLDFGTLEPLETRSLLVRPERSQVSEFCTRLTTITPGMASSGMTFAEALKTLRSEFRSKDRLFASYGDYDRKIFARQGLALGLPSPFGPRHLNVKNLLAVTLGLEQEIGMADALARLGLPLEGTHHRGGDDSRNIARILAKLLAGARRGI